VKITTSLETLLDEIYPETCIQHIYKDYRVFFDRAILTPKNSIIIKINILILDRIQGELHTFQFIKSVDQDED